MEHIESNIDYSKYHKTTGLSTKHWGPSGWYFLFSCIMGAYPIRLDKNNSEHLETRRHFKNMMGSLRYTMPCIFCRNSFRSFYKEMPIDNFLCGRIELMLWLYLIRDRVNQKLILQETEAFDKERVRLNKLRLTGKLNNSQYKTKLAEFRKQICITKPSPPFREILDKYESIRAGCSKKAKKCSILNNKK